MSKIVELYVRELTREGSTMTINDVPKKLRKPVAAVGIPKRTTSAPMLISIIVSPHKSRRAAGRGPPCCWAYSSTSSK